MAVIVILAAGLVWGWGAWMQKPHSRSWASHLSFFAFALATASALLALISMCCGPWAYYDPKLLRIYRLGCLISLTGILFSIGGVWRPSTLRWFAPACSFGALLFWLGAAASE
jgi:hypothetical protein